MQVLFSILLLLFLTQLQSVQSARVDCPEQAESCSCEDENECEFTLIVDELQTFTSYEIDSNGNERTRGTAGSTYYLDENGYHLNNVPGERRSCAITTDPLVYDTEFGNNMCSIPITVDGETYRLFIAVNGSIPGPTLIVNENVLVRVSVINKLTSEGITIHWHGMHQRGTPWMDGVGFISQAPITPGATFDYIFRATPPGTHWYHSHVGAQRTDGLFGALIVRESDDILDNVRAALTMTGSNSYDEIVDMPSVHTLSLLDWQREASLDLFVRIHSSLRFYPGKPIGDIPNNNHMLYDPPTVGPDSIEVGPVFYWSGLINGRGRHNASKPSPLSVFRVEANKAYRFRLVGAQSLYAYSFSIDDHKLRVIATDGHFIRPVDVDYIIVHSGERYDFVLETFGKSEQNYWIRAETLEINLDPGVEHSARAILTYSNDNIDWRTIYDSIQVTARSCTPELPCNVLNCPFKSYPPDDNRNCIRLDTLNPFSSLSASFNPCENPDSCTKFFNFGFEGISLTSAINGKNFELPITPYQTYCGRYNDNRDDRESCGRCTESSNNFVDCRCIHVESIMESEQFDKDRPETALTQIMVFSAVGLGNRREFAHPIHLHGHSFHVLHIGYGTYSDTNELMDSSTDVTCQEQQLCLNPTWSSGEPMDVRTAANNLNTHILKDTVIVPAGGYVAVAFPADNPGYWFLHCHIEVHQLEGMGVLIQEYPHTQHRVPPPRINDIGNFRLEISEFQELPTASCSAAAPTEPSTTPAAATATAIVNTVLVLCALVAIAII